MSSFFRTPSNQKPIKAASLLSLFPPAPRANNVANNIKLGLQTSGVHDNPSALPSQTRLCLNIVIGEESDERLRCACLTRHKAVIKPWPAPDFSLNPINDATLYLPTKII
ncbi:hypothetical protein NPIL_74811 [Nephila pilipes]|uniref:Uncharacterized protein n=1 Tax=Nephila pilipes TaxID=299642 RepID=A0A8X6TGX8_NEPPI|nr:hypothetical protein NPIL_74811 [Nephila pilipes]